MSQGGGPKGLTGHWGSALHSYILYHHQHITQPLLLEQ